MQTHQAFNAQPHFNPRTSGAPSDDYAREFAALNRRHGVQYNLTKPHKHFDLRPGEVLQEETDPATRVQTIRPVQAADINPNAATMAWMVTDDAQIVPYLSCGPEECD